ncbi:MAG: outer membrane PBP1 activator LpoA protein [Phenylobacterium sp.]|jgi:outer membrane PBP1 activator LpoA protein
MPLNQSKPTLFALLDHKVASKSVRIIIITLFGAYLAACASQAPKTVAQTETKPVVTAPAKPVVYSSDDYLRKAKLNNDSPTLLLRSAQTAFEEGSFNKSLIIVKSLAKANPPPEISVRLLLTEVRNYLALKQLNAAEQMLNSKQADNPEIKHDIALLRIDLYSQQRRYIESLRQLFAVEKHIENGEIQADHGDIARTIWQQLNQLPDISLNTFEYEDYTNAKSWIQLVQLTRLYAGSPSKLQRHLQNWYELHPMHAAMSVLPESFQRSLAIEPFAPKRIAVLLPFTGKFRKQAQAVRNGLLVANQDKHNIELMFIDSELPLTTVEQRLQSQQADFVIGPLLKEKVQALASSEVLANLPTLFLNSAAPADTVNQQHYFFGLNPEDEVKQAAIRMFKLGYRKPSIIAPRNATGKRLSAIFIDTWQTQRSSEQIMQPETSYFSDQKEMQIAVKNILDVEQSKQRIAKIKSLINKNLKTESRNRKDLDVVYVIGNNIQTKLIKPLIDVNTSPFTTPLPVYATSRSHATGSDNSDKRDLKSLTFTEIPWLLDSERRYARQRILFDQLWSHQNESLKRLFALGYDSLFLIDRIAQLRVLNGLTEQGMSGLISIDANGFISRQHLWAQYDNKGQVVPVVFN